MHSKATSLVLLNQAKQALQYDILCGIGFRFNTICDEEFQARDHHIPTTDKPLAFDGSPCLPPYHAAADRRHGGSSPHFALRPIRRWHIFDSPAAGDRTVRRPTTKEI